MQSYYSWIHHSKQLLPSFIRSNRKYISFFIFFFQQNRCFFRLFLLPLTGRLHGQVNMFNGVFGFLYILSSSRHEFCFSVIKITLEKKTFYYYKQTDDGACLTLRVVYIFFRLASDMSRLHLDKFRWRKQKTRCTTRIHLSVNMIVLLCVVVVGDKPKWKQ